MIANKYNLITNEYEEVTIPDNYHISTWESSLESKIVCPSCLKEIKFGDGFTSKKFQDKFGFGYCVCESCYNNEKAEETLRNG